MGAIKPAIEVGVERYAESNLPTIHGTFCVRVYRHGAGEEALAVSLGEFSSREPVFVRIHSECLTSEVLGSLRCDCREQLHMALAEINERGTGVLVYLRQEGRGIGLGNKIRAYALQDDGADTIEANHELGFDTDLREFDVAAAILADLGIDHVELHTNNPEKLRTIKDHGIQIATRLPAHGTVNKHNRGYLETKHRDLGHDLAALLDSDSETAAVAGKL